MAELPRSFPRHPVFHPGELDAQHRFGVADEAERMSDAVTTRLSLGVRQFVESQPFMFVGAACGGGASMTCDIVQSRRDANGDLLPVVRVIDTKTLRFALPAAHDGDGGRIDAAPATAAGSDCCSSISCAACATGSTVAPRCAPICRKRTRRRGRWAARSSS